jgi:hypothetical protein
MAFTVNMPSVPTYAGGQLGPTVSGNTLEDVANMAQIDTSRQALKKAKATFGADVQTAKAQAERATTEAASAQNKFGIEQANTMYQILAPYGSDKRIIDAESLTPESTPDQINKTRDNLFDASDAIARQLEAQGMSRGDVRKYTHELNDQILKDPRQVPNLIKRVTQTLAGVSNIAQQNQPSVATVNGQTTTIVPSRGVVPLQGTQQPNAPATPSGEPTGVSQGAMNMPQMQYPVRKAGEAYAQLPNEPKDLEDGRAFRGNLIAAQLELPKMRRNVEEVIKEASALEKSAMNQGAGITGKIERELSTFLGTEEGVRYKQLSKDLANAQLTAIQASGGSLNTDAGKQLAAMANGDVTYPPKVLQQIARRTQADMSNLDMQATAAQKFTQLYGDQNINTFKQMWSSNADSKVFELKNIYDNPKLSAKEKDAARIELLGTDKKTLEDFARKWKNIQKLEKTGSL